MSKTYSDSPMTARPIPAWQLLRADEVRSIHDDTRSVRSVARAWKLPRTVVMSIKAGRDWGWLSSVPGTISTTTTEEPDG